MTDKELLSQVLADVRYIKERQDEFIDRAHQDRIEDTEKHASHDKRLATVEKTVEQMVWMAGKVALTAAALLHGVAVVIWSIAKSWMEG